MAEYVRDDFSRTLASGWGTAVVGGAWTEGGLSGGVTSVASGAVTVGRFTMQALAASLVHERLAASSSQRDVAIACRFRAVTIPTATGFRIMARTQTASPITDPNAYVGYIVVNPDGSLSVAVGYLPGSAAALVTLGIFTYPAGTYTAGALWRLELEVYGSPTAIRARVWDTAQPAPDQADGWVMVTGDTNGPQVAGVPQVRISRVAPGVATDSLFDVDDFYVTDIPRPSYTWAISASPPAAANTAVLTYAGTGDPITYTWVFGDGSANSTGIGPKTHTYPVGAWVAWIVITTRWGTTWRYSDTVLVAYQPVVPRPMIPSVIIGGIDRCAQVYQASWSRGGAHWTDGLTGGTCSIGLRGRPAIDTGDGIQLALPDAAGGVSLWTGIVDQVTYHVDPIDGKDATQITGSDIVAQLARWHIASTTNLAEHALPARLAALQPMTRVRYRPKWSGVPGSRWPTLKSKDWKADKLRHVSYLDMIRDACQASIATAYTAGNGDIVYAPWDAPAGVSSTPFVDLDGTLDCPASVDFDRRTLAGMVNRWTVGDGDPVDRPRRSSIEAYGELSYDVATGVLKTESDFPLTDGFFYAMASPKRCPEAIIPVGKPAQNALRVSPLDLARFEGILYAVLGVRHDVTLSGWRVTLSLDRNPWTINGRTPP